MNHKRVLIGVVLIVVLISTYAWLTRPKPTLHIHPDDIVVQAYLNDVKPTTKVPIPNYYSKYIEMKIDNKKKSPSFNPYDYTIRIYPVFAYDPLTSWTFENASYDDFSLGIDSVSQALVKREVEKAGFAEQRDLISHQVGFSYLKDKYPITSKFFIPKDEHMPDTYNTFVVVTYIQRSGNLSWSKTIPLN
ncbi:hypothetical protein [Paenibacillus sp. SN-8-1]|uniref:hypothetical protein n=1 Tax=Paenibacillus sp. SN-8-1 TaxID=3435409 RepID=UPI003D9A4AC9